MSPYPKYKYHATEPPKQVKSEAEEQALGSEWQDTYIKQDYPKAKYKAKPGAKPGEVPYEYAVANTPEDESKLGSGWSDKPPEAHAAPHAVAEEAKAPPKK